MRLTLTKTVVEDLEVLFQFQRDAEAIRLAAFTPENPNDKDAYIEKYSKHLADPTIAMWTIRVEQNIVGSIAKFVVEGDTEVTYWIDRKYWGQGIATGALIELVRTEPTRPILGRVAHDNRPSQRVLEKCGFLRTGTEQGFAHARQSEIEEFIYQLS